MGSDLVIGGHDGNQGRVVRQRPANVVRGNQTVFVHRQIGDAKAVPFQRAAAVQHCVMLDGGGNDVLFARLCCSAADGPVVTFTAPGGEVNFPGLGMKRRGHLPPGVLHRLAGLPPSCVNGAGIARPVAEEGQHFGKDFRPDRRGGGVVQVDHGLMTFPALARASTMAHMQTSREYHLLSAGTTYHGASREEVWRIISSYAFWYWSQNSRS